MDPPSRKRARSSDPSPTAVRQAKHHRVDSPSDAPDHIEPPQPSFGPSLRGMLASADRDDVPVAPSSSRLSTGPVIPPSSGQSSNNVVADPSAAGYPPQYSYSSASVFSPTEDLYSLSFRALSSLHNLMKEDGFTTGAGLFFLLDITQQHYGKAPNEYFIGKPPEYFHGVLRYDEDLAAEMRRLIDLVNIFDFPHSQKLFNSITYHMFRPTDSFPPPVSRDVKHEEEQSALLVRDAWDTPLLGATDIKLVKTLQASVAAGPAASMDYSNTVTTLQSSGTGKTRSAHESGKFVFSFPVSLLPGTGGAVFPRPDVSIRDLMTRPAGTLAEDTIYPARYGHIIRLLAAFATQFLDGQTWKESKQPRAYLEKVNAWNLYLRDHREELYSLVAMRVEDLEQSFRKTPLTEAATHAWRNPESRRTKQALLALHGVLRGTSSVESRTFEGDELLPDSHQCILSESEMKEVHVTVDGLVKRWKTVTGTSISTFWPTTPTGLFVLIYFDEAHVLLPDKDEPITRPARSQYEHLLSALNDLLTVIFAVFLSTSSRLRQFAPPKALVASARHAKSQYLQPPITECPFDCFVRKISISTLMLDELSTVKFMARFGRPLFWTMLNAGADKVDEETRIKLVTQLVLAKLTGLESKDINHHKWYSDIARLAVLDVRMCLDYEPRKFLSIELQAELVAFHLRLAYSVPEDRLYIYSGYSSEPFMAEIAACIMRAWIWHWSDASLSWNPLHELAWRMNESLLDRGERGEVVGRYILIRAYDLAMIILNNDTVRGWSFSAGCPLNTFIRGLFCESTADDVLASYPDNVASSKTFGEVFKLAYVRFTHFAKLIDTSGLTTVGLAAAFIRGMAFIAKAGQIFVDLIVPILLDYTKPVSPENMSAILIQIKRRVRAGTAAKYNYTAEELGLFEDSDPKLPRAARKKELAAIRNRPYITLLLELGVKPVETPSAQAARAKSKGKGKAKAAPPSTKAAPKAKTTVKAKAPEQAKSKPSTKAGSSKVPAQPSDDGGDGAVASGSAGPSAGGPAMATRARTKAQTAQAAPSKQPTQIAPSTQTGQTASTKKTATSKVVIGAAPERQSVRIRKNLPHPRFNIRVYGCSETVYKVFTEEDRPIVERILLSKLTMFEEHPRKDRIADLWEMKAFWAAPDSFSWSDRVPIVNDQPVEPDDALVEIERYAGGDDDAEDEDSDMDE